MDRGITGLAPSPEFLFYLCPGLSLPPSGTQTAQPVLWVGAVDSFQESAGVLRAAAPADTAATSSGCGAGPGGRLGSCPSLSPLTPGPASADRFDSEWGRHSFAVSGGAAGRGAGEHSGSSRRFRGVFPGDNGFSDVNGGPSGSPPAFRFSDFGGRRLPPDLSSAAAPRHPDTGGGHGREFARPLDGVHRPRLPQVGGCPVEVGQSLCAASREGPGPRGPVL